MSDTTSIMDLPTDPVNGGNIGGNNTGNNGGINLRVEENVSNQNMTLDQTTINQIVSGLQQASSTGATQLQSRDIPRSTENIVNDAQIQPNYIPPQSNQDYITEYEQNDDIIHNYNKNTKYNTNLDQIYDELQTPILLSVMYFLFQLPIFKKILYKFLPILFLKDGNVNLYGYVFTSSLFGFIYYILVKILGYFNTF
jgi:hypothetical protein